MADIVNLRTERKRAKRRDHDAYAEANRLKHGQPKAARDLAEARREKTRRDLEGHRLQGDGE